jgi:hypothetical protein
MATAPVLVYFILTHFMVLGSRTTDLSLAFLPGLDEDLDGRAAGRFMIVAADAAGRFAIDG